MLRVHCAAIIVAAAVSSGRAHEAHAGSEDVGICPVGEIALLRACSTWLS